MSHQELLSFWDGGNPSTPDKYQQCFYGPTVARRSRGTTHVLPGPPVP